MLLSLLILLLLSLLLSQQQKEQTAQNTEDLRHCPQWGSCMLCRCPQTSGPLPSLQRPQNLRVMITTPESRHSKADVISKLCFRWLFPLKLEVLSGTLSLHLLGPLTKPAPPPPPPSGAGDAPTSASGSSTRKASYRLSWGTWNGALCSDRRGRSPAAELHSQTRQESQCCSQLPVDTRCSHHTTTIRETELDRGCHTDTLESVFIFFKS